MRQARLGAVAVVAVLLLSPCATASAEDAPPVEPPVVAPPASPADNPPLVSEPPDYQQPPPVVIPPVVDTPYVAPPVDVWSMTDAERLAYLSNEAQKQVEADLQQWMRENWSHLYNDGGSAGSNEVAAVAAAAMVASKPGEPWAQLSTTPTRSLSHRRSATTERLLSQRLTFRYETPHTTEVAFVVVNGSSTATTATITWSSESEQTSDRIRIEAGATAQSTLVLPPQQDLSSELGQITATFTAPEGAREEISFVAMVSPVSPRDVPDGARSWRVAPPR